MHVLLLIMLLTPPGFILHMSQRPGPGVLIQVLLSSGGQNLGLGGLLEAASPGGAGVSVVKVRKRNMLETSGLSNLLPAVLLLITSQLYPHLEKRKSRYVLIKDHA